MRHGETPGSAERSRTIADAARGRQPSASASLDWWARRWSGTEYATDRGFALVLVDHAPRNYNRLLDRLQKASLSGALRYVGSLDGARVLDVGCGIGRWVREWSARGADVVGVDLSPRLLATNLAGDGGGRYAAMSAQRLALRENAFDLVSSVTVLQHMPREEQLAAVEAIVRVVRPGGWILLHEHVRGRGVGAEATMTFSNSVAEWERAFARHGCRLVFHERAPLLPLFSAYWLVRNAVAKRLRQPPPPAARASAVEPPPGGRAMRTWYRRLNHLAYWLLAWPSRPAEHVVRRIPRVQALAERWGAGAHATLLLRKE